MKPTYLVCLACFGLCLPTQALTLGMTPQAVKTERGKPESQMEIGNRMVWIYSDQTKLEFESGKLASASGIVLKTPTGKTPSAPKAAPTPRASPVTNAPGLLSDSSSNEKEPHIPTARDNFTITESIQIDSFTAADIGQSYDYSAINEDLNRAIENYEHTKGTPEAKDPRIHIRNVLIGFILEVVITMIVLHVAFSLSGVPLLFRQNVLLSLAVALAGAMLDYFIHISLLNPIRIGIGFILLLLLIRQMTDVREWATAIRITLLARLISLGFMWLGFAGVMVLFGL